MLFINNIISEIFEQEENIEQGCLSRAFAF
jgi:hypothetical protein